MRIATADGRLRVRGWFSERFRAAVRDVTAVKIIVGRSEPPRILARFLNPPYELTAVLIWAEAQSIALVPYDRGFDLAVQALKADRWDIDAAIERATKTPYIRESVLKLER